MRVSTRRHRWLLVSAGAATLAVAASDVALVSVGHAEQQDSQSQNYSIYNGQVATAADREQVGTEVDVGFDGGAVNNFYPLARVDVAVAGTSAAASPADTGPLAQAVFAGQNITQPQYVFAQSPGNENPLPYNAGPATASASATQASAVAAASYGAVGNTATAPAGSTADGSDGGTSSARSYFDSTLGFVTVGDSRVHHASYGGGMLVLDDVHVSVQVSSAGSGAFAKAVSVTVGSAYVNAGGTQVPVTIDQNGVTVQQQNLAPFDQVQAVSGTINSELAQAGISVHTVAPQVTQDGDNLHVEAEGVVVEVQQTGTPNGVPRQFVRHTLGEVVMDNEAVLAPPQPDLGAFAPPPDVVTPTAPPTVNTTTSGSVPVAASPTPVAVVPGGSTVHYFRVRPQRLVAVETRARAWLLPGYLAWQALMIALAGALYLQRTAQRRTP